MNSLQKALLASGLVSKPLKPVANLPTRQKSINSVPNPLPIPNICCHCGSNVTLVDNAQIYGKPYGNWPYAYLCSSSKCFSYVGLHPYTLIPLGSLATASMRNARKKAKAVFNPLWESGNMTRSEAYIWLAGELGIINTEECHIGWFDVETCNKVITICELKHSENTI